MVLPFLRSSLDREREKKMRMKVKVVAKKGMNKELLYSLCPLMNGHLVSQVHLAVRLERLATPR